MPALASTQRAIELHRPNMMQSFRRRAVTASIKTQPFFADFIVMPYEDLMGRRWSVIGNAVLRMLTSKAAWKSHGNRTSHRDNQGPHVDDAAAPDGVSWRDCCI
jgi:hypothetical protein